MPDLRAIKILQSSKHFVKHVSRENQRIFRNILSITVTLLKKVYFHLFNVMLTEKCHFLPQHDLIYIE